MKGIEEIELVVKVPKYMFEAFQDRYKYPNKGNGINLLEYAIAKGTPLPKGHGRLVDISKIDEDKVESDNPIIYLEINGQCTEAISLDYLNDLPTIVEADKEDEDGND